MTNTEPSPQTGAQWFPFFFWRTNLFTSLPSELSAFAGEGAKGDVVLTEGSKRKKGGFCEEENQPVIQVETRFFLLKGKNHRGFQGSFLSRVFNFSPENKGKKRRNTVQKANAGICSVCCMCLLWFKGLTFFWLKRHTVICGMGCCSTWQPAQSRRLLFVVSWMAKVGLPVLGVTFYPFYPVYFWVAHRLCKKQIIIKSTKPGLQTLPKKYGIFIQTYTNQSKTSVTSSSLHHPSS